MELSIIIKGVVANKLKKLAKERKLSHPNMLRAEGEALLKKLENYSVYSITTDGNFTSVLIAHQGYGSFIGVAKRNPKDVYNAKRGEYLAASRAVHRALDLNT